MNQRIENEELKIKPTWIPNNEHELFVIAMTLYVYGMCFIFILSIGRKMVWY